MEAPVAVSIVVASHGRPLRMRWLLEALAEQTLDRSAWELIVVHTYDAATARRIFDGHPQARRVAIEPGTGSPSRQRNIGWREARADLVAFTDDDCRPERGWLEALLAAAHAAPGAVVQGRTRAEPLERELLKAPHVRTLWIDPVNPYRQTANILYPRDLLERLGGFDERAVAGEDVGLSLRAEASNARITAAPEAIVNHAVESHTLPGILRQNLKWRYLAYLVRQHPEFRSQMAWRIFWDDDHLLTTGAVVGMAAARRHPLFLALAAPYVRRALARRGRGRKARLIAAAELPGQAVRQVAEVAGMAAGGVRHRTLVL